MAAAGGPVGQRPPTRLCLQRLLLLRLTRHRNARAVYALDVGGSTLSAYMVAGEMTLPGGVKLATKMSQGVPLHVAVATPKATLVLLFHTSWVKWPRALSNVLVKGLPVESKYGPGDCAEPLISSYHMFTPAASKSPNDVGVYELPPSVTA